MPSSLISFLSSIVIVNLSNGSFLLTNITIQGGVNVSTASISILGNMTLSPAGSLSLSNLTSVNIGGASPLFLIAVL